MVRRNGLCHWYPQLWSYGKDTLAPLRKQYIHAQAQQYGGERALLNKESTRPLQAPSCSFSVRSRSAHDILRKIYWSICLYIKKKKVKYSCKITIRKKNVYSNLRWSFRQLGHSCWSRDPFGWCVELWSFIHFLRQVIFIVVCFY